MKTNENVPVATDIISLLELKLLMISIINTHAKIRIKCLMENGIWTNQFLSVMMVTEKGFVLNDDANNKITSVQFLGQVVQYSADLHGINHDR
jgi:hypothetical protein